MKCYYLVIVVFLLAILWQPLAAEDEGESTTEGESSEAPTTKKPSKGKTTKSNEISLAGGVIKLDRAKAGALYKELGKNIDLKNNNTQKMLLELSTKFGKLLAPVTKCIGGGWIMTCRSQLARCFAMSIPQLCIWKVACGAPQECQKGGTTTTSRTTMSPGRVFLRTMAKNAGLQCDRLTTCFRDMGLSITRLLGKGLKSIEKVLEDASPATVATTAQDETTAETTAAPE